MSHQFSTQAKYTKVNKAKEQTEKNEIRITGDGSARRYIGYAASLLLATENRSDKIILKASGNAAKTACLVAEILRTHILGLHQLNVIKTIEVKDEYEPKEEGLDKVVISRSLAVLEIQLSTKDKAFDTKEPGYQAPLPKNQVEEKSLEDFLKRETRRRDGGEGHEDGEGRRERRGDRRGGRRGGRRGDRRGGRGGRRGGDRRDGGERRDYGGDRREYGGERRDYGGDRREGETRRYGGDRREGGERRDYGGDRREYGGDRREYGGERREYGGDRREYGGERRGGDRRGGRGTFRGERRGGDRREGGERREYGGERRGGDRRRGGERRD